jgi:hypothetical protein
LQQPTAFRLATHTISDAFNDEHLITQLGSYSEERQSSACEPQDGAYSDHHPTSMLFLAIDAAADYHSSNKTLMKFPPDVKVDIILDPYVLGLLPRSLLPTVVYVVCVAIMAYYMSGHIYAYIRGPTKAEKNEKKKSKVS